MYSIVEFPSEGAMLRSRYYANPDTSKPTHPKSLRKNHERIFQSGGYVEWEIDI